jgi:calcineurin-like phosphoesterase
MVGPWNSVLGVQTDKIIYKFITGLPVRFEVEEQGPQVFSAIIVEIDDKTNKTLGIESILLTDD